MIVYFADRNMRITGQATTYLPKGLRLEDDNKVEDVDTGVASFSSVISYNDASRSAVEKLAEAGNYILRNREADGEAEFYTIIDSEVDDGKKSISIYAEDAGLDLLNDVADPFEATEAHTIEWYAKMWITDAGFEIGVNEIPDLTRTLKWEGEATVTERLDSLATEFDNAELSFSFKIEKMIVTKKYLNIYKKRGKDVGVTLRKDQDFKDLTITKSIANLATALKATGSTVNSESSSSSEKVTLQGYSYDDGDFYVEDGLLKSRKALEKWSRYSWEKKTGNYDGHIVKTFSYDTESQSELFNRTLNKLKSICDVEVNYEISVTELPDSVGLGDTIMLIDEVGELYLSARLLKLETSEINRTKKATIGEYLIKEGGINEKVQYLASEFSKLAESRTLYTWIVYADDENGSGISLESDGKKYIGICPNRLKETPDLMDASIYNWTLIEGKNGNDGKSFIGMTEYYLVSSFSTGITVETEGWSENIPTMSAENKYLWNYEVIHFSDETTQTTEPKVIGVYGDPGKTPPEIIKMEREYYLSSSNTELSGGSWGPSLPQWSDGKYLWSRWATYWSEPNPTPITYSEGLLDSIWNEVHETAKEANTKAAEAKANADDAKSQVSQVNSELATVNTEINALTSNLETLENTMSTDYAKKQELTKVESTLASSISQNAAQISSVVSRVDQVDIDVSAAQSAADAAQSAADAAESKAKDAQEKYTALKSQTDATDEELAAAKAAVEQAQKDATAAGDAAASAKSLADSLESRVDKTETRITQNAESIGLTAEKVTKVEKAAGSVINEYSLSTSATEYIAYPTGYLWSSNPPAYVDGKYMWMRTKTVYADTSLPATYSDPVCIAGATGAKGEDGVNGTDGRGIKATTITYQAGDSQTTAPTGIWSDTVPVTSTDNPYLWTKTVIEYTSGDPSTSYSVSSTLDSVEVGDRNLLLKSDVTTKSSSDVIGDYVFGNEKPVQGEEYTLVVNVAFGSDRVYLAGYNSGDTYSAGFDRIDADDSIGDGVYRKKFKWSGVTTDETSNTFLRIKQYPTGSSETTIKWIKLVRGNSTSSVWTPAPEDMATGNELHSVSETASSTVTRVTALETSWESSFDTLAGRVTTTETWQSNNDAALAEMKQVTGLFIKNGEFKFSFEDVLKSVENNKEEIQKQNKYVQIVEDATEGATIVIGDSQSGMVAEFTKTALTFKNGDVVLATYANDGLTVENITTRNQLMFEGHGWAIRPGREISSGKFNLNDVWIGG